MLQLEQAQPLVDWINERQAIYMRKAILEDQAAQGLQYPALSNTGRLAWGKGGWTLDRLTEDPILGTYRFCNVFRELDRVTVWIRENIREPYADHEHLWYMLAIARFINWPDTLEWLIEAGSGGAWPDHRRFSPVEMSAALEVRRDSGKKMETGAYMIRAESDPKKEWYSWPKQRYVSEIVLGRFWQGREMIKDLLESPGLSLKDAFEALRAFPGAVGWGPFMTHQVIVDLRWTRYLEDAPDLGRWASIGPGSARGLNRLHGRELKKGVSQSQALDEMLELSELVHQPGVLKPWVPAIELADIQNCLCETDKWLRAKSGEGRPRSQYVPGRGS